MPAKTRSKGPKAAKAVKRTSTRARPAGQRRSPKKGGKRPPRPPVWQGAFLAALGDSGNVRGACERAKVGRSTVYDRRKTDDDFRAAWDDALQNAADVLEAEAMRRAVFGVQEPVFYKGKVVGHVQRYSDVLLIFLLKGIRPEKYRDFYKVEHTGRDGGPIQIDARQILASRLDAIAERRRATRGARKPHSG